MGNNKVPPPGWGSGKVKGLFQNIGRALFSKDTANLRRIAAIVASFVLVAATVAWLTTSTNQEINAFDAGTTDIEIVEPNVPNPNDVPWGSDSKNVKIEMKDNGKNTSALVRVMVIPMLRDSMGNTLEGKLGVMSEPSGNTMVLGDFTFHFDSNWKTNWMYKDGFFYYRKVLEPGAETPYLLRGVTLTDSSKGADYQGKEVHIDVKADAVQKAAADDWGLKVDQNDNVSFK